MSGIEFRFSSKKDYEIELQVMILKLQNFRTNKAAAGQMKKLEPEYEDLLEEYVRFCAEGTENAEQ